MSSLASSPPPWLISEELWALFEPLIPLQQPAVHGRTGRPRVSDRGVLEGIACSRTGSTAVQATGSVTAGPRVGRRSVRRRPSYRALRSSVTSRRRRVLPDPAVCYYREWLNAEQLTGRGAMSAQVGHGMSPSPDSASHPQTGDALVTFS